MNVLRKPHIAKKNIYNALNINKHFGSLATKGTFRRGELKRKNLRCKNELAHQHVSTSVHQHVSTSAYHHIITLTHY